MGQANVKRIKLIFDTLQRLSHIDGWWWWSAWCLDGAAGVFVGNGKSGEWGSRIAASLMPDARRRLLHGHVVQGTTALIFVLHFQNVFDEAGFLASLPLWKQIINESRS
nr:hypothetical protein CFP56_24395 [Quercus suber]